MKILSEHGVCGSPPALGAGYTGSTPVALTIFIEGNTMKVGDVVIVKNFEATLHCSHHIYTHAIVASISPFILVSEEGDMLW